jgi:hypothetical protein
MIDNAFLRYLGQPQKLLRRCRGVSRRNPPEAQKFFGSFFQKRTACLPHHLAENATIEDGVAI